MYYVCMYVRMYLCMYVRMYVLMYVHMWPADRQFIMYGLYHV